MNRRQFITGLLATSFALGADAPRQTAPLAPPLTGVDILPANGRRPTSMVVLLHGFGGNGEQMRAMAEAWARLLPDTVFVLPDAPEQCRDNTDPASRQWFGIRALEPDNVARATQIRRTEPVLNAYITAKLSQYALHDSQLVIAGVSQGAMMALQAAPRRSRACAGTIAYNGMLADPEGLRRDHIVRMPVLVAHGRQDNVVPFAHQATVAGAFRREGFKVETVSYNLGHSVNNEGLQRGAAFIRTCLVARKHRPFLHRIFGK